MNLGLYDRSQLFLRKHTNFEKREEFEAYARKIFPDVEVTDVFDCGKGLLEWRFLGSIALDIEEKDFHKLESYFLDENGNPKSIDAMHYIYDLNTAKHWHNVHEDNWARELSGY